MAHGFVSPIAALDAIKACLAESWPIDGTVVHVGSDGSGEGLDCCPALVRIETERSTSQLDALTQTDGPALAALKHGCKPSGVDLVVRYRECFTPQDGTVEGKPQAAYEAAGRNVVLGWWQALQLLICCDAINQNVEYLGQTDFPASGCIGWDLRFRARVSFCSCSMA